MVVIKAARLAISHRRLPINFLTAPSPSPSPIPQNATLRSVRKINAIAGPNSGNPILEPLKSRTCRPSSPSPPPPSPPGSSETASAVGSRDRHLRVAPCGDGAHPVAAKQAAPVALVPGCVVVSRPLIGGWNSVSKYSESVHY
jgi:hypothetical protein